MSADATYFKAVKYLLGAIGLGTVLVALALAFTAAPWWLIVLVGLLPVVVFFVVKVFVNPQLGLVAALLASFLAIGVNRYIPGPLGLSLDGLLLLTFVACIFYNSKSLFQKANNPLTWITVVWFLYCFLELFNPNMVSRVAWFYAVRGVGLYLLFTIPLGFMLFSDQKSLNTFLKIWLGFSVLCFLWGVKQRYIGPDFAENRWLDAGGRITHVIQGTLRSFGFYSDAGQYGAAMAHASLVAIILGLGPFSIKKKVLLIAIGGLLIFGMMLSGTRGALGIPALGFLLFAFLSKNFKLFGVTLLAGLAVFCFLKFTYIGQSNYNIRRMRTALDPNDASLQVRKDNQAKIAEFLVDKPFGAGIGSGGSWALRFAPESFLAKTPLDSWYVKIWAEMGIVGLLLHLGYIFFVLGYTFYPIFNCPDPALKFKLMALYCGFAGVAFASYGNQIFGQSPTGTILALSMVFLFSVKRMLKEGKEETIES